MDFFGVRCESSVREACSEAKCPVNATCFFNYDVQNAECVCPKGFTGRNCNEKKTCQKRICANNGTCRLDSDEREFCKFDQILRIK